MSEQDKWTRKLVRLLKELGFTDVSSKRAPHRKYRLESDKLQKPCTVVVQRKMHEYARADAIKQIVDNLKDAGANDSLISQFDKMALGMLLAEPDDDFEDLIGSLKTAIKMNDRRAVAVASFELGRRIEKGHRHENSSIIFDIFEEEDNIKNKEIKYKNEITDILSDLFERALRAHIDRNGCFEFYARFGGNVDRFDEEVVNHFGFKITSHSAGDDEIVLSGIFAGELKEIFLTFTDRLHFEASIIDEDGETDKSIYRTDDFYKVRLPFLELESNEYEQMIKQLDQYRLMQILAWKYSD